MQIHEVIKQIKDETGIMLSRSRLYHYDRLGMLGEVGRKKNKYRTFDMQMYNRLRFIVLLSDVGVGLDKIKDVLNESVTVDEIRNELSTKYHNIRYLLNNLS